MVGCAGSGLLRLFLGGELSASQSEDLAEHVESCEECRSRLQQLADPAADLPQIAFAREPDESDAEPAPEFLDRLVRALEKSSPPPGARPGRRTGRIGSDLDNSLSGFNRGDVSIPNSAVPGYEILSELSRGGMGVVYKARQLGLNRLVALKMILGGARDGATARARFRTEAEAVARLDHPNIIRIHDIGECDGRPYFSMELINGPTVAEACEGRPQPAQAAAVLIENLARAIQHAHSAGILHRDLKPDNVLLQPSGDGGSRLGAPAQSHLVGSGSLFTTRAWNPKLIDFGLAKRLDDFKMTQHGLVVGTPSYMAPEQVPGAGRPSTPSVDIYSLGVMLYELLTGRPPFDTGSIETTLAILASQEPIAPRRLRPDMSRDLETICLKCIEKVPARRYATAQELADDLARFVAGLPILARPPSMVDRFAKLAMRNKLVVACAASVLTAIALGIAATGMMSIRESRARHLADRRAREATANGALAEAARVAARRETYQARLAAALAALAHRDIREASRQLEMAPEAMRGWEWRHLQGRLDQSLAVLGGPRLGQHAGICPPGNRVAVADGRSEFRLLDAVSGECVATYAAERPCNQVFGFQTSVGPRFVLDQSGEEFLLSVTDEKGAALGRVTLSTPYHPRKQPKPLVIAMSRDGKRIAFQSQRYAEAPLVEVFDTATGRRTAGCGVTRARLLGLDFSPDGSCLAAILESAQVFLFDVATGKETGTLSGHEGILRGVAYSPEGRSLASCGDDQTIRVWDVPGGANVCTLRGHVGAVTSVAFSPDSRQLVSGGSDGTIRVWNATGGEALLVLHGHTGEVTRVTVADNGRRIASTALDGTVRLWDAQSLGDACELKGHTNFVYPVAFSLDGRQIASGSWDQTVRVWDAGGGPARVLRGHAKAIGALAFTRDGRLASWSEDETIVLWDTDTGHAIATLTHQSMPQRDSVYSLLVSPDGKHLSAVTDDSVRSWDLATRSELPRLTLPIHGVRVIAYSPDGSRLAAGGDNPNVVIVDVASGDTLCELTGFSGRIQSLVFSPDGRQILTAGQDPALRLWDATTCRLVRTFAGHGLEVLGAIFHPDGTRIASGGHDRSVLIWDVATGDELVRLAGHTSYVFSLAFSPDGQTLVSGSGDTTVRLWDAFPVARRMRDR
jgi:WD40 repeat protein/serine/threonine protein kinase